MNTGVELIAAERSRQVEGEGWTAEHDHRHGDQSLAWAAVCYAAPDLVFRRQGFEGDVGEGPRRNAGATAYMWTFKDPWPWDRPRGDKRGPRPWADRERRIRELVKAGALIAAEIDRLTSVGTQDQEDTSDG